MASSNLRLKPASLSGWIVTADGTRHEANPELVERCIELWTARADGRQIDALIDGLKSLILTGFDGLDPSCAILVEGVCRVTLKKGSAKPVIKDIGAVRDLLGPRFKDLVDVKTSYVPTDKLLDMLANADDALAQALCEHVVVKIGEPTIAIVAA